MTISRRHLVRAALIVPGIAAFEMIEANHRFAIEPDAVFGRHPLHPDATLPGLIERADHHTIHRGVQVIAAIPDAPTVACTTLRNDAGPTGRLLDTGSCRRVFLSGVSGFHPDQDPSVAAQTERMFLRAIELRPSLDMAHYWWSWQLALFGRMEEAFEEHEIAKALDPLNPLHTAGLGWLYLFEEQWEEAEREARLALEVDPQDGMGLYVLAEALAARGRHEEALEVARRARPGGRGWILGRQLALAGHTDEARAIAAEMEAEMEADGPTPWGAWTIAVLYSTLGEKDDAFRWLDYEHIHCWVIGINTLRPFEPLRDDPRFPGLMERMNLPLESP